MSTNLPSCFSIQFLEQLLKFLVTFTLLKYVKSQRNYDFLITKELIFGFQILDLKDHFSASLSAFNYLDDFILAYSLSVSKIYLGVPLLLYSFHAPVVKVLNILTDSSVTFWVQINFNCLNYDLWFVLNISSSMVVLRWLFSQ